MARMKLSICTDKLKHKQIFINLIIYLQIIHNAQILFLHIVYTVSMNKLKVYFHHLTMKKVFQQSYQRKIFRG